MYINTCVHLYVHVYTPIRCIYIYRHEVTRDYAESWTENFLKNKFTATSQEVRSAFFYPVKVAEATTGIVFQAVANVNILLLSLLFYPLLVCGNCVEPGEKCLSKYECCSCKCFMYCYGKHGSGCKSFWNQWAKHSDCREEMKCRKKIGGSKSRKRPKFDFWWQDTQTDVLQFVIVE